MHTPFFPFFSSPQIICSTLSEAVIIFVTGDEGRRRQAQSAPQSTEIPLGVALAGSGGVFGGDKSEFLLCFFFVFAFGAQRKSLSEPINFLFFSGHPEEKIPFL